MVHKAAMPFLVVATMMLISRSAFKVIYGLRGWIAFAAFLDMGAAVQCYIDAESFLGLHLHASLSGEEHVSPAMARLLGSHRVLAALILTHCAFCIHHKPILSMAICSCTLTIITNYMETFYYQTAPLNFYTIFPVVIAVLTITGLCVAPSYLKPPEIEAEEETHMLRMGFPRKKNWNKKRP